MNKRRPRWVLKQSPGELLRTQQEGSLKCKNKLASLSKLERPALISSLLAALKECTQVRELDTGRKAHALAIENRVLSNVYVANNLINMYGKCGSMVEAREVFDGMNHRSVVSWNSIIQGYVDNGEFERGLRLFHRMQSDFVPDARSYVAALSACTGMVASKGAGDWIEAGKELHSEAVFNRCCNIVVVNSLISLYGRCGCLALARGVFDKMPQRSVVSWNALLQSCVENGETELALEIFSGIQEPDERSFVAALTSCASLAAREDGSTPVWLERGRGIHSRALENGCSGNVVVETALVDMYSKCGSMVEAREVFEGMRRRDAVSWTCLIQGYVENGDSWVALELFERMVITVQPDAWTYVAALGACAVLAAAASDRVEWLEKGKRIHSRAVASSSSSTFVENAMIHLYSRCGSLAEARALFDAMPEPSPVTLKLLLQGYADQGHHERGLELLLGHQEVEMILDPGVLSSAVSTCGNLMAEECGKVFHSEILRGGFEQRPGVVSCLIEFYGKCGRIAAAKNEFDSSWEVDVWMWNSLLGGYSLRGQVREFFRAFHEMREQAINPNAVSFTHLLTVCSHAGLTCTGRKWFGLMEAGFGVPPDLVHYTCMVDLLARGNRVDEALKVLESMPFTPNLVTWTAVLTGCWKWGNVDAGRFAFDELLKLYGGNASAYNLMANLTVP